MLRWSLLILLFPASLPAQFQWKCDPKDGKFTATLCATCKKFYCWDGEIFSEEEGYTPAPPYVLAYWAEVRRHSEQIRADIQRRGKELQDRVEMGKQETERLNRESLQTHKQFTDELNRRIAASRAASHAPSPSPGSARGFLTPNRQALPSDIVVEAAAPQSSAPTMTPCARASIAEVQLGMDRAAVERILGKPHSSISIPEDDGLVESLAYTLEDHATARVRIEKGKVASVKIAE